MMDALHNQNNTLKKTLTLEDFDYDLPEDLIAQVPLAQRSASKLLHLDSQQQLHDRQFTDLPELLKAGDLLVLNNTKVIKARLFGKKSSGGKVEILVERLFDTDTVLAHVKASKAPGAGTKLILSDVIEATVEGRENDLFKIHFKAPVLELLEQYGTTPLPPYIKRPTDQIGSSSKASQQLAMDDEQRYQTLYAQHPGAVAAPTAGLHFDAATLTRLDALGVKRCYVTLHVGAGTFLPVRSSHLAEHIMHSEWFNVPQDTVAAVRAARAAGARVVAVGTTSVRALESASSSGSIESTQGDTRLFITPGYEFKSVDALITNFHLPKSTLLMLISAFAGREAIKAAYSHAISKKYRFFSYGDAMLIEKPLG